MGMHSSHIKSIALKQSAPILVLPQRNTNEAFVTGFVCDQLYRSEFVALYKRCLHCFQRNTYGKIIPQSGR